MQCKAYRTSQMFTSAIKEGPDYVCTCCHRLMYHKTVVEFNASKYSKVSGQLMSILSFSVPVQKGKDGYAKHVILL